MVYCLQQSQEGLPLLIWPICLGCSDNLLFWEFEVCFDPELFVSIYNWLKRGWCVMVSDKAIWLSNAIEETHPSAAVLIPSQSLWPPCAVVVSPPRGSVQKAHLKCLHCFTSTRGSHSAQHHLPSGKMKRQKKRNKLGLVANRPKGRW